MTRVDIFREEKGSSEPNRNFRYGSVYVLPQ